MEPTHAARPLPHAGPRHHPAVLRELARADDVQLRLADLVTRFAGSMPFVYVHVVAFAVWMLLLEASPWPTLTLVVSLEAIFLATFVMIGQNRQAAFQRARADHDFVAEQLELRDNTAATRRIEESLRELGARSYSPRITCTHRSGSSENGTCPEPGRST